VTIEVREIQGSDDLEAVARLRWRWVAENRDPGQDVDTFVRDFSEWWARQPAIVGAVAVDDGPTSGSPGGRVVGMAFLVVVDRVPAPGELDRTSGDIQSVYVEAEHRGHGTGTRLLELLTARARERGCIRMTVNSSSRALPYYGRLGFQLHERVLTNVLTS
jgi:GNAT superfamily N-acetyltransferase